MDWFLKIKSVSFPPTTTLLMTESVSSPTVTSSESVSKSSGKRGREYLKIEEFLLHHQILSRWTAPPKAVLPKSVLTEVFSHWKEPLPSYL